MAVYSFAGSVGTTIAFDPATDVLTFGGTFPAGLLRFEVSGNDLIVRHGTSSWVRLATVSFGGLTSANFQFANGGVALFDDAGAQALSGTGSSDYIDVRDGGADVVDAGGGDDRVVAQDALDAADRIDGGAGSNDELSVSGDLSVAFQAGTVTGVERIAVGAGTVSLTLAAETVSTATASSGQLFTVDASAQTESDRLALDASRAVGAVAVRGGGGADVVTGGTAADSLHGGDGNDSIVGDAGSAGGNDTLAGGLGADTLTGGAGTDTFRFAFTNNKRSESSPAAPDVVTDFEGAGIDGGDLIDLPSYNLWSQPLAFNAGAIRFTFNGFGASGVQLPAELVGDGFIDVVWRFVPASGTASARFEVWVDSDDDGQFSETDILVHLNRVGSTSTSLVLGDFVQNFKVWRGTQGNDAYAGTPDNNDAYGLAGNDRLFGFGGHDQLYGGEGNDSLDGEAGSDRLSGGAGNDTLLGGDGGDVLTADTAAASGRPGSLDSTFHANRLDGGAGDDTLIGGDGLDTLTGGEDGDDLFGGKGSDSLSGDGGQDRMVGGAGADTLVGGLGADLFAVEDFAAGSVESKLFSMDTFADFSQADGDKIDLDVASRGHLSGPASSTSLPLVWRGNLAAREASGGLPFGMALPGQDIGTGFYQVWWVPATQGGAPAGGWLVIDLNGDFKLDADDLVVRVGSAANPVTLTRADFVEDTFVAIVGDGGNNDLVGADSVDDIMFGLAGADTIQGFDGKDSILGQDGDDVIGGGAGADTIRGGLGDDSIEGGDGHDTIFGDTEVPKDTTPNDNVLNGGAGDDYIVGARGSDTMDGGEGSDLFHGQIGADVQVGGAGADIFAYRNFAPTIMESTIDEMDVIVDFSAAEGDKICLYSSVPSYLEGYKGTLPLVWRGSLAAVEASSGLSVGMRLGGDDIGTGFYQTWWVPATQNGAAAGGWFVIDLNSDFELDALDTVVRVGSIDNPVTLGKEDFVDKSFEDCAFRAIVGTLGNDGLLGSDTVGDLMFGLAGDDTIDGLAGMDFIYAGAGNDRVLGGMGDDWLYGMQGNDTLVGGYGDDLLLADANGAIVGRDDETHQNVLHGQAGADTLTGAIGRDTLLGGTENDSLYGGLGNDSLNGEAGIDRVVGGGGADRLHGGSEADRFVFGRFTDEVLDSTLLAMDTLVDFSADQGDKIEISIPNTGTINGPGGTLPLIWRGSLPARAEANLQPGLALPGQDIGPDFFQVWWIPATANGAAAGGWLVIDLDRDFQLGNGDFVARVGSATNPVSLTASDFAPGTFIAVAGTAGVDRMAGDAAHNLLFGLGGNDYLQGFAGDDKLYGGDGQDRLVGGTQKDQLYGQNGNDVLFGDDGDDTLSGGAGNDQLNGGNDKDRLGADATNSVDLATHTNTLNGGFGDDVLVGGAGLDTLNGEADNDTMSGAGGNDLLDGGDGADSLRGDDGLDRLLGGAGTDRLVGGAGADEIRGGGEADTYVFENLRSAAPDSSVSAFDTLADFSVAEGDKIELAMTTPGLINGPGGQLPLLWRGAVAARDVSAGPPSGVSLPGQSSGTGAYQIWWVPAMEGGAPAGGWLVVDLSRDFVVGTDDLVVRVGSAANPVTLTRDDFAPGTFAAVMGTTGDDALSGGVGSDLIYGLPGDDVIDGLAGADRLSGNEGNDRLGGGDGNDTLSGGSGSDTLSGGNDRDQLAADGADGLDAATDRNLLDGGSGNDTLTGGAGLDTLLGGDGADSLLGWEGADSIDGGIGVDTVAGGLGSDRVVYDAADLSASGGEDLNGLDQDILVLTSFVAVNLSSATDQVAGGGRTTGFEGVDFSALSAGVSFTGDGAANTVIGSGGADTLGGGAGQDTLTGGLGADSFVFDTAPNSLTNVDTIADFSRVSDTIRLENAVFAGLTQTGTLTAAAFRLGTAAADADDRIMYDAGTGRVFYDADGNGVAANAIQIAILTGAPVIDRADFLVV